MILLTLSRGNEHERVHLRLPASPAEIGEAFVILDGIKLRELRKLRRRLLEAAGEDRQIHDTERMMEYLEDGPEWLDEVPAELFGELIERIIIISPERLKFRLLNGMELAENIERTVR